LLEACASGKPAVTANTIGCRDIIKDGENGLVVEPRNPNDLADAIQKLLDNPILRASMGTRGRKVVEKEFSEEIIVKNTIDLYHEMIKN